MRLHQISPCLAQPFEQDPFKPFEVTLLRSVGHLNEQFPKREQPRRAVFLIVHIFNVEARQRRGYKTRFF